MADIQYYGTGRRKTSTARVYLRPGSGDIIVNRRSFDSYFPNEALRMIIRQPLSLTDTAGKFDVTRRAAGNMAFVLRIVRGIAAYVSGRIAKLSPDAVRLETPTSIVGVRGTHMLIRVEAP